MYIECYYFELSLFSSMSLPCKSCFPCRFCVSFRIASARNISHGIKARGLRKRKPNPREEQGKKMDRGMASSLPTERLDRSKYASWSYKMHWYLLGHRYCSYVNGANDAAPEPTNRDFPAWEQSASRVLYCFASIVSEQFLSYIRDVRMPEDSWGNVKKLSLQAPQPRSSNSDRS